MKNHRTHVCRIAAVALAVAGCSETPPAPEDAGMNTPDTGVEEPPELGGLVQIGEVHMNTFDMWMVGAGAGFALPSERTAPTPIATYGFCNVFEQEEPGAGAPVRDGGSIQVTGGVYDFDLTMASGGYAASIPRTVDDLFAGGETMHVQAEGGPDVPAFALDVVAPAPIDVLSPCLSCGLDVDRALEWSITWTPGAEGEVHLELSGGGVAVACVAPDAAGALTVPVEALAHLPATANGMLMFKRTGRAQTSAGDVALVTAEIDSTQCSMGMIR